jgi:hypothetical protein
MNWNRLVIAGAMVAGLMLGVVLGPTLQSSVASAQTTPTQTTPTRGALWSSFLDQLASALNIQRSALDSAIVTAGNATADNAVQQGTLTEAQADALKARIQAGDIGALFGGRGHGPRGRQDFAGVQQAMVDAAASTLGITADELKTQLRSGQTLAQLAQANGTTEQAVVNAALAAAKTKLDEAVAAGTLTQAQADAAYAQLQQRGAQLFVPRGRGHRGAPTQPTATPEATS